jgi:hypothetical protein
MSRRAPVPASALRRQIGAWLAVAVLGLAVLAGRTARLAATALEEAHAARSAGRAGEAIRGYAEAIRLHIPGSPYSAQAQDALAAMAAPSGAADPALAIRAREALTAALVATGQARPAGTTARGARRADSPTPTRTPLRLLLAAIAATSCVALFFRRGVDRGRRLVAPWAITTSAAFAAALWLALGAIAAG